MDRRTMMLSTAAAAALATSSLRSLAQQGGTSSPALGALFDQFVKENLDISPLTVTQFGLDKGARAKQKSEIDDGSEAGIQKQKDLITSQLARLKAFDRSKLNAADAVSYDVVLYGLQTTDAANRAFDYGAGGAGQIIITYTASSAHYGGMMSRDSRWDAAHSQSDCDQPDRRGAARVGGAEPLRQDRGADATTLAHRVDGSGWHGDP